MNTRIDAKQHMVSQQQVWIAQNRAHLDRHQARPTRQHIGDKCKTGRLRPRIEPTTHNPLRKTKQQTQKNKQQNDTDSNRPRRFCMMFAGLRALASHQPTESPSQTNTTTTQKTESGDTFERQAEHWKKTTTHGWCECDYGTTQTLNHQIQLQHSTHKNHETNKGMIKLIEDYGYHITLHTKARTKARKHEGTSRMGIGGTSG